MIAAAALLIGFATPSAITNQTTEDLYGNCAELVAIDTKPAAEIDATKAMYCAGYMDGAMSMMNLLGSVEGSNVKRLCFPAGGITFQRMAKAFVRYVDTNPRAVRDPASIVALSVIVEVLGCEASGK